MTVLPMMETCVITCLLVCFVLWCAVMCRVWFTLWTQCGRAWQCAAAVNMAAFGKLPASYGAKGGCQPFTGALCHLW